MRPDSRLLRLLNASQVRHPSKYSSSRERKHNSRKIWASIENPILIFL